MTSDISGLSDISDLGESDITHFGWCELLDSNAYFLNIEKLICPLTLMVLFFTKFIN